MAKKLLSFLLVLSLCFSLMVPVGVAEGAVDGEGGSETPAITEPVSEEEPEAPEVPEAPEAPEMTEPPAADPTPTPRKLFLAAVALLPQDPDALEIEAVTLELEEQLKDVTGQMEALLGEEELQALTDMITGAALDEAPLDPLHSAALLVLRLNARVAELNTWAAQAVRDLIAVLPAAETMTIGQHHKHGSVSKYILRYPLF